MKLKIGVLGSGVVGQTLAKGFKDNGYQVKVGTGDVVKIEIFKNEKEINGK